MSSTAGRTHCVDTGFIVFNDWTYPNFIRLLDELQVPWQPSDMSFSVRCEKSGLEYNGTSLNSLFAQRRNLVRPSFLRMVADIMKLQPPRAGAACSNAARHFEPRRVSASRRLLPLLRRALHHPHGRRDLVVPPRRHVGISGALFRRVFRQSRLPERHHRPTWRVIQGGSREYIKRLTAPYAARIRLNTPVTGDAAPAPPHRRATAGRQRRTVRPGVHGLPQRPGVEAVVRPQPRRARDPRCHRLPGK